MKTVVALALILFAASALCFAEAPKTPELPAAPYANRGDIILHAGALYGWYGFGIGGGAEYIFAAWDTGKSVPLTFGAAAAASFGYPGLDADFGATATMHLGLNTFSSLPRFLRNFDFNWGLGFGACVGAYFGAGPLLTSSVAYFVSPSAAIEVTVNVPYYIGLGVGYTGMLGVMWKL